MENLEIFKGVISEELFSQLEAETKESKIKLADLSKGEYVLAGRVTGLEAQLEKVNNALTEKTKEYDALKEKAGDNQSLQAEIENLKTAHNDEVERLKNEFATQQKHSAIVAEINTKFKPKDVKDLLPYVDESKVTIENDVITGLSEQLNSVKENKPYLFSDDEGKKGKSGVDHSGGEDIDDESLRQAFGLKTKE